MHLFESIRNTESKFVVNEQFMGLKIILQNITILFYLFSWKFIFHIKIPDF